MRILIADDDPTTLKYLHGLLSGLGHEVVSAIDGEEALNALRGPTAPRIAVLDWKMPKLDGLQVCKEARKNTGSNYVYTILITGEQNKEAMLSALNAGADDFLLKPFDPKELDARIRAGERLIHLQQEVIFARETLMRQSTHDQLTGLPNRLLFSERLKQSINKAKRTGHMVAVMFVDLDRFKMVNDSLGHNIGDHLLVVVSERLQNCLREADTFARMGADEFTVILDDVESTDDVAKVGRRIQEELSAPFNIPSGEFFVSASIGISLYPQDGEDVETLVKNSDTAMYRAKEKGRNNFQFYTQSLNAEAVERITFENSLRKALDRKELHLAYQPQVCMQTGKILGVEALIRWRHPEYGIVSPGQFIPIAEETGLIVPIGEWVLRTACEQNRLWQEAGLPTIEVGVNVSARQLECLNVVDLVKDALDESGLDPHDLCVEITESALMNNRDHAVQVLEEIKSIGVRIALDDFGTGYSSLSYLKRFPIDIVKIDQSFVKDITTDPDDAALAGAVVAIAHTLKLQAIAEGVETLEQLEFLRSLGCDMMQGYFISRPVSAHEITDQLQAPTRAAPSMLHAAA